MIKKTADITAATPKKTRYVIKPSIFIASSPTALTGGVKIIKRISPDCLPGEKNAAGTGWAAVKA